MECIIEVIKKTECMVLLNTGMRRKLALLLLWTPAQRSLSEVHYILPMFFLNFFYGRLILRPWLTEVRESVTRGGP